MRTPHRSHPESGLNRIAFVGNYLPRQCGIATFTTDLCKSVAPRRFDQQPIEAAATVSACLEAVRLTLDIRWQREARRAFEWFLGRNDLAVPLYDPATGGCRDGLHANRANENQGAESTLAFLNSRFSRCIWPTTFSIQWPMAKSIKLNRHTELFYRHTDNPILTAADWPYPIHSVFNAGATMLSDGTTLLLCRVEDRRGHSHLCAARSRTGVGDWVIDEVPTLLPDPARYPEEVWGIEDPRITHVPELRQYVIAYTSFSPGGGAGVSLALTEDFCRFERIGVVMPPHDKDAADG